MKGNVLIDSISAVTCHFNIRPAVTRALTKKEQSTEGEPGEIRGYITSIGLLAVNTHCIIQSYSSISIPAFP
jgi:hypothetical protein